MDRRGNYGQNKEKPVNTETISLQDVPAWVQALPVLPNMKDSLDSSPLWVTITILYIRPCSKFWKEILWICGLTWVLSWSVPSGLYRKMLYPLSSPFEVVQLKVRCLVEFSVILRLVTAAGTGKVERESETEFQHPWHSPGLTPRWTHSMAAQNTTWSLPSENIDFMGTPKQRRLNFVHYWCLNC